MSNNINHLSLSFGNILVNNGMSPLNPLDVTEKAIAQKAPNQTKNSNVKFICSMYKNTYITYISAYNAAFSCMFIIFYHYCPVKVD